MQCNSTLLLEQVWLCMFVNNARISHVFFPSPHIRDQVSELTFLIARMQRNSDQVEQNILRAEDLLDIVSPFVSSNNNSSMLKSKQTQSPFSHIRTYVNTHV